MRQSLVLSLTLPLEAELQTHPEKVSRGRSTAQGADFQQFRQK